MNVVIYRAGFMGTFTELHSLAGTRNCTRQTKTKLANYFVEVFNIKSFQRIPTPPYGKEAKTHKNFQKQTPSDIFFQRYSKNRPIKFHVPT
jgi:hypothetical protein